MHENRTENSSFGENTKEVFGRKRGRGRPRGRCGLNGRKWVEREFMVYCLILGEEEGGREDNFNRALYGIGSEKRLLVAILARAILDLTVSGARVGFAGNSNKEDVSKCSYVKAVRRSAWQWFYGERVDEWSYRWVCQHLDLSCSYILEQLERLGLLGGEPNRFPRVEHEFQQILMQTASIC